eukprot:m.25948 g.25948  ORF g.25948 m.25948 type:complete len:85 (+) comp7753_c0_seq1:119-373(+)
MRISTGKPIFSSVLPAVEHSVLKSFSRRVAYFSYLVEILNHLNESIHGTPILTSVQCHRCDLQADSSLVFGNVQHCSKPKRKRP